jgi:hypothetical protein
MLPSDVTLYVIRRFVDSERAEALDLLENAQIEDGQEASDRLKRCAVVGANGSLEGLRAMVELLAVDWRDVVMCGEYEYNDGDTIKVRDLSRPIGPQE